MRALNSWARVVGERTLGPGYFAADETAMPAHMLRLQTRTEDTPNRMRPEARAALHLSPWTRRGRVRIDENSQMRRPGRYFAQQSEPLVAQLGNEKIDTGRVAARLGESSDKTERDRVIANAKVDGIVEVAA